ncbi:Cytochrome P450 6B6 [Eumeta japonica]|uniref:unspecific monooxygenase n=1 Tax=Eumeta variegata TaxID=151549 RepID=A0A4C1ZQA8_EUMVA|nr:Cytochrome P450 6B6 [Eumeta japonica]
MGIACDFLLQNRAVFELTHEIYNKYPDAPAVGTFAFATPALVLRDLKNIEEVMTGDFNTFNDRGFNINPKVDRLADNVLLMNGIRWKLTRQKMTPLFTSSKLRNMYYIMDKSGKDFVEYLRTEPKEQAFDILTTFCSAAIGASVFGIHTQSIMDSPFLKMARKALEPSPTLTLRFTLNDMFPKLLEIFKLKIFGDFEEFFIGAIKNVLRVREQQATRTHDFADLCMGLQQKGTMRDPETGYEMEPTDELMAAQAFFFFIAGVEPSATAMFFALFEMAKHPDIQSRVHEEIDQVFDECDGKLTFEAVTNMKYLDMVLDESMRMHPAIGNLLRRCMRDGAVLPVGNIKVDKGTLIHLPIYAIHHDPRHYPEPEKFIPERFSQENKKNINNYAFLPFGEGHRICIGMRFARLQVKTGLVHALRHFTVETRDAGTNIKFGKLPAQMRPTNIDLQFVLRASS